jgi:hypothetical protein
MLSRSGRASWVGTTCLVLAPHSRGWAVLLEQSGTRAELGSGESVDAAAHVAIGVLLTKLDEELDAAKRAFEELRARRKSVDSIE